NATFRLAGDRPVPRYEAALAPRGAPVTDELDALARALDERLGEQSAQYRRARATGELDAVAVLPVDSTAFLREWERRVHAGQRPPRVKDRVCQTDPAAWQRIVAGATGGAA